MILGTKCCDGWLGSNPQQRMSPQDMRFRGLGRHGDLDPGHPFTMR
jgi:hypothetical protein